MTDDRHVRTAPRGPRSSEAVAESLRQRVSALVDETRQMADAAEAHLARARAHLDNAAAIFASYEARALEQESRVRHLNGEATSDTQPDSTTRRVERSALNGHPENRT